MFVNARPVTPQTPTQLNPTQQSPTQAPTQLPQPQTTQPEETSKTTLIILGAVAVTILIAALLLGLFWDRIF